jgi:DNA polymerase
MEFEFSAGILVYRRNAGELEFLFLKNKDGWLDFPKGHIEESEHALEAAVRETLEETGLRIKPDVFFRKDSYYWFLRGKTRIKKRLTMFLGEAKSGSVVTVSDEHIGYAWLRQEHALKELKFRDQIDFIRAATEYIGRRAEIDELNESYAGLWKKQKRWDLSRNFVPGYGPVNAEIMLIGQAPGAEEDKQGKPFVGRSGVLLTSLLEKAGLDRNRIYITSTVQFFPPKNRVPDKTEIGLCLPFLMRQVEIIDPELIILVGAVSAKALANVEHVAHNHGTLKSYNGRKFFITLHPAAAVRIRTNMQLIESDFIKLGRILKEV